jgi:uncharacterized protein (DUF2235 family)
MSSRPSDAASHVCSASLLAYGLEEDIRDAYVFLMDQFNEGDRLFLFGFSRGAYTVRAVASLLHMYGLIPKGNEPLVPYAIRMMLAIHRLGDGPDAREKVHAYFQLADDFKKTFSAISCKPWFVGVWDTVSSVGWYENPLHLPFAANSPDIEIGRHAISLDERRAFFRTNLWIPPQDPSRPRGPKDLKQVWFAGVHADVGGGYPEAESGLAKIALQWMLDEASGKGLLVDPEKRNLVLGGALPYVHPNPNGPIHKSLKRWWWLAEFIWKRHFDWQTHQWKRRPNLGRWRTIPLGSVIHPSVFERNGTYSDRDKEAASARCNLLHVS